MAANASQEYQRALERSNAAGKVFSKVQADYRAQRIGDEEYLAARRVYQAAQQEFDAAYAREDERESEMHAQRHAESFSRGEFDEPGDEYESNARRGAQASKPGRHGTLYLWRVTYRDTIDPGFGERSVLKWAYDKQHVWDVFNEQVNAEGESWEIVKIDPAAGKGSETTPNPVHLKLDGNFSFGIGTEDDKAMKKNARSPRSPKLVTDEQIEALRQEAGQAGDLQMVRICDRALAGSGPARQTCWYEITNAQAQTPNATRGHCRICGETLPPGEVICAHHEREGLSNDPRWADLPSWEEARGRIHGGQHSLVENARKNVSAVINAFEAGRSHREATCSTTSRRIVAVTEISGRKYRRLSRLPRNT